MFSFFIFSHFKKQDAEYTLPKDSGSKNFETWKVTPDQSLYHI